MALLNKLLTLYLLFNPLRALGLMADKPKVEPAGGMICAPLSEIQEAVEHKNFSIPNWVTAEEVCEERNGKTLLFGNKIKPKTQTSYTLRNNIGNVLFSSEKASVIINWVKAHESNAIYSPNNQCSLIVTMYGVRSGRNECIYTDFAGAFSSDNEDVAGIDSYCENDIWSLIEKTRQNCPSRCP